MLSSSAGIDVAYEPTKATALPEKSVIIELREEMTLAGFMSVERSPSMSGEELGYLFARSAESGSDRLIEEFGQPADCIADIAHELYDEQDDEQSYRAVKEYNDDGGRCLAVEAKLFYGKVHERAQKQCNEQRYGKRKERGQHKAHRKHRESEQDHKIEEVDYEAFFLFDVHGYAPQRSFR